MTVREGDACTMSDRKPPVLPRQTQLNAWMRLANQRMPVKTMAGIWRGFILGRTQRTEGHVGRGNLALGSKRFLRMMKMLLRMRKNNMQGRKMSMVLILVRTQQLKLYQVKK